MGVGYDFVSIRLVICQNHSNGTGLQGLHAFIDSRGNTSKADQDLVLHLAVVEGSRLA